jgi:hypothetical protein
VRKLRHRWLCAFSELERDRSRWCVVEKERKRGQGKEDEVGMRRKKV